MPGKVSTFYITTCTSCIRTCLNTRYSNTCTHCGGYAICETVPERDARLGITNNPATWYPKDELKGTEYERKECKV